MRKACLLLLALLAWGASTASADDGPLLAVLCEHYDCVLLYKMGTPLVAVGHPLAVNAPHDAAWDPSRRLLYVACAYKSRPCVVTYVVSEDLSFRLLGDPVPTAAPSPSLLLRGHWLYAWDRGHVQAFSLGPDGVPVGLPPEAFVAGCEAILIPGEGRIAYVLADGEVSGRLLDGHTGLPLIQVGDPCAAGFGASSMALDEAGRHLYVLVLEGADQHVRTFDVAADGIVRPSSLPLTTTRSEAQKRMVMAGGTAYVLNVSSTLSVYKEDGASGRLTAIGRPVRAPDGIDDLLVYRGRAYAVGGGDHSLWTYRVHPADGALARTSPMPLENGAAGTRLLLLK